MINIWPDSLLFAAVYGVVESASTVIFGPIVGKLVDRLTYLQVLMNIKTLIHGLINFNVFFFGEGLFRFILISGSSDLVDNTEPVIYFGGRHSNCIAVFLATHVPKFQCFYIADYHHPCFWCSWCSFYTCRYNINRERMVIN